MADSGLDKQISLDEVEPIHITDGPEEESKELPELLPTWQLDGFDDEDCYHDHMVRLVDDLLDESKRRWKEVKQRWRQADKKLEQSPELDTGIGSDPTRTDLPFVPQAIEEAIAVQCESLPRPNVVSRQESQNEFTSALNYFVGEELDSNNFDVLMARVTLDMKRFNLGVVKQTVDAYQTGPFGQQPKILLTQVDPRYIWPDPLARTFDDCRYVVEARPMDLSDIRELFPERGHYVMAEEGYSLSRKEETSDDDATGGTGIEFANNHVIGERRRAVVKECWLKDDQKYEVEVIDENGECVLDQDGNKVKRLEKRYPHGRLIITANGILLKDIKNPFRHGQRPYTFIPGRITPQLLSYGDVEILGRIEDKINRLHKDMMRNARSNMNAPWIVDQHAFDSPKKFGNITNDPGLVLPVRPGSRITRIPPAELPGFIFPLVDWLKSQFDDVLGIQSISRGQLEKGSQLSAEAIQSLQGTATSRIRLKSRLMENGLKQIGHQLQWNIRQFYPAGITAEINDPSNPGKTQKMEWNEAAADSDYSVAIEAGSSLPGAKQGQAQMALTLWQHGLLGPKRTLKMMDLPGVDEAVGERMDMLKELAASNLQQAVREATGGTNSLGQAGRQPQVKL